MSTPKPTIWQALRGAIRDADDPVWSNLAYPLAAVFGDPLEAVVVTLTGLNLAAGSGVYHTYYTGWASRWDVWAMLTYLSGVTAAVWSTYSLWAYAVVPLACAAYWWRQIENFTLMSIHVGLWAGLTLLSVVLQAGWWALLPGGLFGAAAVVRLWISPDSDSWWHSGWHVLGAAAAGTALWLI